MPKTTKQLTDTEIKKAKSKEKDYKLSDGQGLYIVIKKNGSKMWRFDFSFEKKRKSMSFGLYPEISLKEAREKRELARENLRKNINPIDSKNSNFKIETTFKFVALKWLELMKKSWSESNYKKIKSNLENNAFPNIGNKDIKDITRKEILIIIEKMENRNAIEYANRLLNNWSGNIISDIEIK